MSKVPHELIREVQICTRAAAGLPDYDPALPAPQPFSAAIAAADPSPTHLRCKDCKGMLLRGTESIICLYCGLGPNYDAVPDPISFTSTVGYRWLLRSLRLDGSERVDLTNKSERDVGQSSPKSLTPLSEFLNFKISWPAETEKQGTSSEKHSEESKRSFSLTGVPPDRFFLKSKRNGLSDMPIEQPSDHNQIETAARKDVAAHDNQDLFENIQSSKPAVSSSEHKASEALSKWEADFQSADSENQHDGDRSFEHAAGSSADSGVKFQDPESFQSSSGPEVDLSAHFDSVFGPGANLNDRKPKEGAAVSPAFDDWNSDDMWNNLSSSEPNYSSGFDANFSIKNEPQNDMWNNLSSSEPNFTGGFDANFSTKNEPQNDHTLGYSQDPSTTVDLFQDFQSQTNYTETTKDKTTNEEKRTMDKDLFEEWNDFTGSTSLRVPSQDALAGSNDKVSTLGAKSSERDSLSLDNKFEGGDFGSPSQNAWAGGNDQVSTLDEQSLERDLFSFDNKFDGGDFGSFSQPNLFSTSTSNSNAPAEVNAIASEHPTTNWLSGTSSPSLESSQAASKGDASQQSTKDDVKMLISQMHDLSFMLETDLSIPSGSDAPNSSAND